MSRDGKMLVLSSILTIVVGAIALEAQGAVVVRKWNGSAWANPPGGSGGSATVITPGNHVEIDAPSGGQWLVFSNTPSTEDVGTVSFVTVSGSEIGATLYLAQPDEATDVPNPDTIAYASAAFRDWTGGLDPGIHRVAMKGRIGRDVLATGGAMVECARLVRLDVVRHINADVIQRETIVDLNNPQLIVRSIAGNIVGDIISEQGDILLVRTDAGSITGDIIADPGANDPGKIIDILVNGGDLLGDVLAPDGGLKTIDVTDGDIGAVGTPITITARASVAAGDGIVELIAADAIYANSSSAPREQPEPIRLSCASMRERETFEGRSKQVTCSRRSVLLPHLSSARVRISMVMSHFGVDCSGQLQVWAH